MLKYIPLFCVVLGILAVFSYSAWIATRKTTNGKIRETQSLFQEGLKIFNKRLFVPIIIVVATMTAILLVAVNWKGATLYLAGAFLSYIAVYYSMNIILKGNSRTAVAAAISGPRLAFRIAYRSGAVLGLTLCALSLLGLGAAVVLFKLKSMSKIIACFGLGASTIAIFGRIGGGIYNRATNYAAELVSSDYPEVGKDKVNNPVFISHKLGQEIGDVFGMGTDMLETYVGSLVATIMLAIVAVNSSGVNSTFTLSTAAQFPLIIAGIGIVVSIISMLFIRYTAKSEQNGTMVGASIFASIVIAISSFYFSKELMQSYIYGIAISIGLLCSLLVGPISKINQETLPIILVSISVIFAYFIVGSYGIALVAVGMLSISVMSVAYQAFGPITYNVDVIANFSNLSNQTYLITGSLSKLGRKTAPIGKSFSICASVLTSISLLISYASITEIDSISLLDPIILISMLIGSMLPFSYSALVSKSVESSGFKIYNSAKKQLRENRDLVEGNIEPNYKTSFKIAADKSISSVTLPAMLAVIVPILIGMMFGVQALGSLVAGIVASGALKAITTKDISGTSINTFVKTAIFISLAFSAIFVNYGGIIL